MQEIIQTQAIPISQENKQNSLLINSQYINIKNILDQDQFYKCSQKNYSNLICCDQKCEKPGLFCGIPKCPCQKSHQKCKYIMLDRIITSILQKKMDMPKYVKQSYQQLFNEINRMIQELSDIRIKFENQQQYFGITEEQMKFVSFIKDNNIQKINGKLVHSMSYSFQSNFQYDVLTKNQIIQDFQNKRKEFKKFCDQILQRYSKKDKKQLFKEKSFNDSKILEDIKDRSLLISWIKQIPKNQNNQAIQTKLLFRASEHEFKGLQFHKFCDGINDTVIIVKNQHNFVIGGYTHPKYFMAPSDCYGKDDKNQSFLFSINAKEKIKCNKPQNCVRSLPSYGPLLGYGDFYIVDSCNTTRGSHFNPFFSYNVGNKYGDQNATRAKLSDGNHPGVFLVKQYQVYQIKNLN